MSRTYAQTFIWNFDLPAEQVWPALADTQRFNEAAGLPKHEIREETRSDGSVRFHAAAALGPFHLRWEEVPVEWIDGQWFRHLRIFKNGPIRTIDANFRLMPTDDGCVGHYLLKATPANLLGHAILATAFFRKAERNFTQLAAEGCDWAAGARERMFGPLPAPPTAAQKTRLDTLVRRVEATENGHGLTERLVHWMLRSQEMDLMRIRPIALAKYWYEDETEVIDMCLEAVRAGLLELRWDLLCPRCRGAKLSVESLDRLPRDAHCASCNIAYDRDFSRNIELTFHPAPAVREVIDGEYCLFGPMSTPHVKVQVHVGPGERRVLDGKLAPGAYRLRTLEIGGESDVEADGDRFPAVIATDGSVVAGEPGSSGELVFENHAEAARTLIIESREWVKEALTAHRATTLQSFRDLFPNQALAPGEEAEVSQIALMFTDLKGSTAFYERVGDAAAYRAVRAHFALLAGIIRKHRGAIVKTIGDAVMAAFLVPADAMQAAFAIQAAIAGFDEGTKKGDIVIKVGLHAGPCIAVTLNERLDYFGTTVNMAARLQGESQGQDIVWSLEVNSDPEVAALLEGRDVKIESAHLRGFELPVEFRRLVC